MPDSTVSVTPADPPEAVLRAGRKSVVVSSISQVFRSVSVARLRTTRFGCAGDASTDGLVATLLVVVCVCEPALRSQASPMLPAGCASVVTCVLSKRPPSVLREVRCSPTARFVMLSGLTWLRFVTLRMVPRSVRRASTTASPTGFSVASSVVTSAVPSSFSRTSTRCVLPPPASFAERGGSVPPAATFSLSLVAVSKIVLFSLRSTTPAAAIVGVTIVLSFLPPSVLRVDRRSPIFIPLPLTGVAWLRCVTDFCVPCSVRVYSTTASDTGFSTVSVVVWLWRPVGVFSSRTLFPGVSDMLAALAWFRFSVVVRVSKVVSSFVTTASDTGLSTVVTFCTSVVQSEFFVTLRVTAVPLPTLAALPAETPSFTPWCASSFCSSKIVFDVKYSGTSCWTRVRCSSTQL